MKVECLHHMTCKQFFKERHETHAAEAKIKEQERLMKVLVGALEKIEKTECTCYEGCGPCFNLENVIAKEALKQYREARKEG